MNREYYQDYACGFDLTYYPFDTQVNSCIVFTFDSMINSFILQVCTVVVEVQGKTDNFVRLVKDFDGIDFIGNDLILNLLEWVCISICTIEIRHKRTC